MKQKFFFVAACAAALVLNSCDQNDPDIPIAGGTGNVLLTTTLPNANGMDGTTYMQLITTPQVGNTLAVDNSNGINIPYGGSYPMVIGQDIFELSPGDGQERIGEIPPFEWHPSPRGKHAAASQ